MLPFENKAVFVNQYTQFLVIEPIERAVAEAAVRRLSSCACVRVMSNLSRKSYMNLDSATTSAHNGDRQKIIMFSVSVYEMQ